MHKYNHAKKIHIIIQQSVHRLVYGLMYLYNLNLTYIYAFIQISIIIFFHLFYDIHFSTTWGSNQCSHEINVFEFFVYPEKYVIRWLLMHEWKKFGVWFIQLNKNQFFAGYNINLKLFHISLNLFVILFK